MKYKISELAEKSGVTKRTVHYYISKGLLMPPEGEGVNSTYTDEHFQRILLIKKLQEEYMPLNKIREYILENPLKIQEKKSKTKEKVEKIYSRSLSENSNIYFRENVCDIFEIHYTEEYFEKYKYIIENVKKYVEKMLED